MVLEFSTLGLRSATGILHLDFKVLLREFSTLGPRSGTGILHLGSKCGIGIHYFG